MVARSCRNTERRHWRDYGRERGASHRGGRGFHRGVFGRLGTSARGGFRGLAIASALFGTFALAAPSYANTGIGVTQAVDFEQTLAAYQRGDKVTALYEARILGKAGNSDAQVLAGHILRKGEAGTINLIEARDWFQKASVKGHPDALVALGDMAIKNEAGLTHADAVSYLTRAADMGRTDAMKALADLHRTGQGTVKNSEESKRLLLKASQSFDKDAAKKLGDQYFETDPKQALKYYEQAAASGHIEAAYIAGVMYAENFEIRPNSSKSAALLKQAATGGHAAAQADYGLLVYQGYGAAKSDTEAAEWFHKSALGGDKEGQFLYAFTLAKGEGVAQNFEEAYYWLLKSGESSVDDYDKDRKVLRERLEANVDAMVLARAKARLEK